MSLPILARNRGGSFAAGPAAPAAGASEVTLQDDILHWWKLDENTGTTAADSIGGTASDLTTFNGDPEWGTGMNGSAIVGDGVGDYIVRANVSGMGFGGSDFSMTCWAYPTGSGGNYDELFSIHTSDAYSSCVALYFNGADAFGLTAHDSGGFQHSTGTSSQDHDNWYFVVGVIKPETSVQLFWAKVGTDTTVTAVTAAAFATASSSAWDTPAIMSGLATRTSSFPGRVDDCRIYNVALTEDNCNSIYNGGSGDFV